MTEIDVLIRRAPAPEVVSHAPLDLANLKWLPGAPSLAVDIARGVVIDSDVPIHKIFSNLAMNCPEEVLVNQTPLRVFYFGFDGRLHQGQIVVDFRLVDDVLDIFRVMREHRFPLESVIPLSADRFFKDGAWSDDLSMEANNGSAFCFRTVAGQTRLSLHALGMAVDLNPTRNPYFRQVKNAGGGHDHYELAGPANGQYDIQAPGTFTGGHPVVRAFAARGWTWGGTWQEPLDLHHFQKIPAGAEEYVRRYRP